MMTTKNIEACLASLGNPQKTYQTIHIGGTNGKGSTSYFLHQMLSNQKHVGMYVSPYFMTRFDNIWINGNPVNNATAYYDTYKKTFEAFELTPFEEDTALAFIIFHALNVDVAVIEVGLGGTHDATNVIDSDIAVITSCSLEHEDIIGPTIVDIATHQSGIISHSNQKVIISNDIPKGLRDVFINRVDEVGATLLSTLAYPKPLVPLYQQMNASLAYTACVAITGELRMTHDLLYLPFRFQRQDNLIIDGAHNVEGIKTLVSTLKHMHIQPIVIMSTLKTKHTQEMIDVLKEVSKDIIIGTFDHPDAISEVFIKTLNHGKFLSNDGIRRMIKETKHDIILLTGSLYFLRHVKEKLL